MTTTWTTRANELVSFGDLVALSVLKHADAVGRIVAETDLGLIQCVMVRGNHIKPGEFIEVEQDQLLLRVYGLRQVVSEKVCSAVNSLAHCQPQFRTSDRDLRSPTAQQIAHTGSFNCIDAR